MFIKNVAPTIGAAARYVFQLPKEMRIHVPTSMMWGMKDFALTHRMARPSTDHCDESTHWVQNDAAAEVNHYLVDFLLDRISQQVVR